MQNNTFSSHRLVIFFHNFFYILFCYFRCTYIDATHFGNVGRMINHSCQPNLYMVPARVNNSIPRAALFALRVILPGEELAYEYSGDLDGGRNETLNKSVDNEQEQLLTCAKLKVCCCGVDNCRGYLPFDKQTATADPACE